MNIPKHRILLVERDNDATNMVCLYLIKAGYQLTTSSSYAESLTLASTRQFKLYLLGEGFEDRTNLDLCQKIRTFDSNTPILFCSAWAYPTDIDRGLKAGAQAYLIKPCDLPELAQTIERLIGEAATQEIGKSASLRHGANERLSNTRRVAPGLKSSYQYCEEGV